MSTIERDTLDRLDATGLRWYVTVDAIQLAWDERMRQIGPDGRMRLQGEMYRDAFRLVWAQVDRADPMTPLEEARFVLRRLYPDLEGPRLESIMTKLVAEYEAGTWTGFVRP